MVHEVQVILKYLHTCIYKLSDKAKVNHCVCVELRTDKLIVNYNYTKIFLKIHSWYSTKFLVN